MMELTKEEIEILELLDTATKRIRALPALHGQALNHLHDVVCEIASRPYWRKVARDRAKEVNTAVILIEERDTFLFWEVEYFDIDKERNVTKTVSNINSGFIDAQEATSIINKMMYLLYEIPASINGIRGKSL